MIFNDQKLDKTEIECLENYFDEKYDLKIHQPENASCDDLSVLQSCVPDGSVAAWYDGESYDDKNNIWRDKTCNGQDATIKGVLNYFDGTDQTNPLYLKGKSSVYGTYDQTQITFGYASGDNNSYIRANHTLLRGYDF
eukprot:64043_1